MNRSDIERHLGRNADAAADASRAVGLATQLAHPIARSNRIGRAYLALGRALEAQHRTADAHVAFQSAVDHLQTTIGADHPDTRAARVLAERSAPPQ